jgi:hypothetical protein
MVDIPYSHGWTRGAGFSKPHPLSVFGYHSSDAHANIQGHLFSYWIRSRERLALCNYLRDCSCRYCRKHFILHRALSPPNLCSSCKSTSVCTTKIQYLQLTMLCQHYFHPTHNHLYSAFYLALCSYPVEGRKNRAVKQWI